MTVLSQYPTGGRVYPKYQANKILRVEEYNSNYLKSTNLSLDKVLYFNNKGQMVKECFERRYNACYTYEYNKEGFLINIDTLGMFGFGTGISEVF